MQSSTTLIGVSPLCWAYSSPGGKRAATGWTSSVRPDDGVSSSDDGVSSWSVDGGVEGIGQVG